MTIEQVSDGIIAIPDGANVGIIGVEPVFGGFTIEGIIIISTFASVAIDRASQIANGIVTIAAGFPQTIGVG